MNLSNEDLTNKFAEASHKGLLSTESFKLEQEILSCLASGEKDENKRWQVKRKNQKPCHPQIRSKLLFINGQLEIRLNLLFSLERTTG